MIGAKAYDDIKDNYRFVTTTMGLKIVNLIGALIVFYIFMKSARLEGENLFCRQWVKVELIAFVCEIPYFIVYDKNHQDKKDSLKKS